MLEEMKGVVVEKVRVGMTMAFSERAMHMCRDELQVRAYVDHQVKALVVEVTSFVAGHKRGEINVEHKWPADWWQALRERWFPKWWLRRWPVRYKKVSIHETLWNTCPHLEGGGRRPHLEFLMGPERPFRGKEAGDPVRQPL